MSDDVYSVGILLYLMLGLLGDMLPCRPLCGLGNYKRFSRGALHLLNAMLEENPSGAEKPWVGAEPPVGDERGAQGEKEEEGYRDLETVPA